MNSMLEFTIKIFQDFQNSISNHPVILSPEIHQVISLKNYLSSNSSMIREFTGIHKNSIRMGLSLRKLENSSN